MLQNTFANVLLHQRKKSNQELICAHTNIICNNLYAFRSKFIFTKQIHSMMKMLTLLWILTGSNYWDSLHFKQTLDQPTIKKGEYAPLMIQSCIPYILLLYLQPKRGKYSDIIRPSKFAASHHFRKRQKHNFRIPCWVSQGHWVHPPSWARKEHGSTRVAKFVHSNHIF